jgi:ABC-type transport system involved in Fe-S cluster assembly fused permease/ATPase subunit
MIAFYLAVLVYVLVFVRVILWRILLERTRKEMEEIVKSYERKSKLKEEE